MKTRILLLFLAFGLVANAQNIEVSGTQSGIWEADTVFVTGNVLVQEALSIMPGTMVLFNGYYSISVMEDAIIEAIGTENDSILFTVADTTDFHVFNSGRGAWNGIRLEKAGASKFEYCRFQYGKAALDDDQDGGALRIFNCTNVEVNHSTLFSNFSRENGGALNAEGSSVTIHDCNISNNVLYSEIDTIYFMYGGGLRFLNCDVEISETDFRYNYAPSGIGGALSIDRCNVSIDRCRFEHNYGINGGGLYLIDSYETCSITNSLFANNISGHFGGGLAIRDSSPLMSNLTVVGNHSIGVNCGGIFFYQYSAPEVFNCIVYGNTNEAPLEEPVQIWSWTYDGYAPKFHNCLIQYGLENISNYDVVTVYEDCLNEDPLFADLENEDYHLSADSPCVNAGSAETPDVILNGLDLDGNLRVSDGQIDMGAYEFDITGLQETTQSVELIHVVGNPVTASSYAEIVLDKASDLTANVYSIDGKKMGCKHFHQLQAGTNRIDIVEMFQTLSSGTYLFVIQTEGKTLSSKVVKP